MQEHQYQQPVIQDDNSNPLVKFILGLFTGITAAVPITAIIVRKICDRNKQKEIDIAVANAENRAMQAMVETYKEEIENKGGSANRAHSEPNRGIPDGVNAHISNEPIPVEIERPKASQSTTSNDGGVPYDEAYLASLESPTDDDGPDYDLENYNLEIDDEEATREAREFSEAHVTFLDMVEKYKNSGGAIPPMTISRDQFDNEHFYEKSYINWYEGDDVFEEDDTKIDDPYYTFGFKSGNEMFAPELTMNREDPNICHIRNMQVSTDFEITRMHGSYKDNVIDGEAYYNGEASPKY